VQPELDLRLATFADLDELVRLRRVMMDALGVADEPTWPQACAAFLRETMSDASTAAVVAGDPAAPGRLVACGVGCIARRLPGPNTPNGRYGYIASMVTEPAWRGRGLAGGIVAGLLDWFVSRGVHKVDLHASAEGESVYRRAGFREGEFPELRWRAPASGV
jgi:GNAT superfamily N-acetyltransferase